MPALDLGSTALVATIVLAGACGDDATGTGGSSSTGASTTSASTATATSSSSGIPLPDTFTVTGVVTDGASPVEGAIVMQGGGDPSFRTGPDGTFSIAMTKAVGGTPTVVAAKEGYRADGIELVFLPDAPLTLVLREVKPPDDALGYTYGAPGVGDAKKDDSTAVCGHCHTRYVADFLGSGHADATKNPLVQDLYAGVAADVAPGAACAAKGGVTKQGTTPGSPGAATPRCYVGYGVLPDLNGCGAGAAASCDDPSSATKPTHFGHCADCHAAGLDGPAGGRDLLEASGIAFEDGNHCDACHHVRAVDPASKAPGVSGRLVMGRPHESKTGMPGSPLLQAMFGPEPDVPNPFMGGSYQPQFSQSVFCSGCHEYDQDALMPGASLDAAKWPDGLPTLSTYSEWQASSFGTASTPCQFCHMPPVMGLYNSVDVTTPDAYDVAFGFPRPPERLRAHTFREPLDGSPRLIDGTLTGGVAIARVGSEIDVTASIENVGAGHATPTGEPMRALVLVVRAEGCGQSFVATSGMTIADTGGALATAVVGSAATFTGPSLAWAEGAGVAQVGDAVRVVRPTGQWDDYAGVGRFSGATLTAAEKGMQIFDPVGEAHVLSIAGGALALDASIPVLPGDQVYLGAALPSAFADADPARALAGVPGNVFSRVMVDPTGARNVPHHRAVDIASDDRLMPGVPAVSHHTFAIAPGCTSVTVTETALYRPLPVDWARERAWDARDYVVFETATTTALQ